jgi:DNA (cytosine-5)-methyltransferase 1
MSQPGKSGRIVIDVEPELKREIYSTLTKGGTNMKDWFTTTATTFLRETHQPYLFDPKPQPVRKPDRKLTKPLKTISLFSGCGGMDLGFKGGFKFLGRQYEKLPYEIMWANDISEAAARTYRHNLGGEIQVGDIWQKLEYMPKEADIIIGGFPCQDISVNGNGAGVKHGTRSSLYRAMAEAIKIVQPKVFVAENVASLLNHNHKESFRQILTDFVNLGYNVHYQPYTASDFGVPQTRERVFFVGTRLTANGLRSFVPPEPSRGRWVTAQQAIGDLEKADESSDINHVWSRASVSPEQGNRRLKADRPGYTIRAECHGNIQWHYKLPRRISMREAARIQSFPDSFIFQSALRETERQVGNAVPPVMAWHIARAVLDCFL